MTDYIAELQTNFLAALKSTPDLVTELGGDQDDITEYLDEENGDVAAAIVNLTAPALMLYLIEIGPTGRFPGLRSVTFGLVVRTKRRPSAVMEALRQGVPTFVGATDQPLINQSIHLHFHPMSPPVMRRQSLLVGQNAVFDYPLIQTTFTSNRPE